MNKEIFCGFQSNGNLLCQNITGNNLFLTHDVVHAEGAGAVLQQPGVDTVFVELMSTGDDP